MTGPFDAILPSPGHETSGLTQLASYPVASG
jgi:hypothetical protein